MKYRIYLTALTFFSLIITNATGQITFQWGLTARAGTGIYHSQMGSLLQQRFLLPTYGAQLFFEVPLYKQLTLRPSIGYNTRGTAAKGDAVTDSVTQTSLGQYKSRLRDHFVNNDIVFHYQISKRKGEKNPYIEVGIRNEGYLFSNYNIRSDGPYFTPVPNRFFRSKNYRSIVSGALVAAGIQYQRYELGIEYYYQISQLQRYQQNTLVNFNRQSAHTLSITATYRLY